MRRGSGGRGGAERGQQHLPRDTLEESVSFPQMGSFFAQTNELGYEDGAGFGYICVIQMKADES